MTPSTPATAGPYGWQPDPYRRHELRFHDGTTWTEHVSDRGVPGIDTTPVVELPRSRPPDRTAGVDAPPQAEGEVVRVVPETTAGPTTLVDAMVLVVDDLVGGVRSKAGIDCTVQDEHGLPLATVRTGHEPLGARALRLLTSELAVEVSEVDVFDPWGKLRFVIQRPAHLLKARIRVADGEGNAIGELVPTKLIGGLRYELEADGAVVGALEGPGPEDRKLHALDANGTIVARVSTAWEVPSASYHPRPNTHLILVERAMPEPLRSLVLAGLLALDAMLVPAAQPQA